MKEDKRQFTSGVWANGAGEIAFLDLITKGKTERSLPVSSVRAKYPGIKYQYTRNHWASRETKQLSTNRLWDHVVAAKATKLGITVAEAAKVIKIVLMLDCWPVNLTAEYRDFVKANCPGIRLMFIPAGGTGKYQVSGCLQLRSRTSNIPNLTMRRPSFHDAAHRSAIRTFTSHLKICFVRSWTSGCGARCRAG